MANQDTSVKEILRNLSECDETELVSSDDTKKRFVKDFEKYYRAHPRHQYSDISDFVMDAMRKNKDLDSVAYLVDKMNILTEYIHASLPCLHYLDPYMCLEEHCEQKSGDCIASKNLLKSLLKLQDHLYMEYSRWLQIDISNTQIEKTLQEVSTNLEEMTEGQKKLKDTYDELKDNTKNIYMQIVSILGIFTAIVFGVFGGVKALESVGAVIAQPVGHIVIAATLIMLFVIWVIYLLFACIRGLMEKEVTMPKINRAVWWISAGCIVMIIVAMFAVQ